MIVDNYNMIEVIRTFDTDIENEAITEYLIIDINNLNEVMLVENYNLIGIITHFDSWYQ